MRNNILFSLLFGVFLSLLPACQTKPSCGTEVRAAFDVGSGSTKMKVAQLDLCTNTVVKIVLDDQVKIDYRESLEKSKDEQIPSGTVEAGITALNTLKDKATKLGAQNFTGVATAAFRQAKNGEQVIQDIRKATGIPLRIISQNVEALIGFQAASLKIKKDPAHIISWDIGGGSQQIVVINEAKQPSVYLGELASVSFKNRVLTEVKKKNLKKINSPNPLDQSQIEKAIRIAEKEAIKSVPADIKARLEQTQNTTVVGIGGVLSKSVLKQFKNETQVTPALLRTALDQRAGYTDKKIGDAFAATEVTNLALVYGYMKALKIKSYRPMDVNLIDGLWFQAELWPE